LGEQPVKSWHRRFEQAMRISLLLLGDCSGDSSCLPQPFLGWRGCSRVFDSIREVLAQTAEARAYGYTPGRSAST
jgi:hypothetical protein